jgi:hypothetical protein
MSPSLTRLRISHRRSGRLVGDPTLEGAQGRVAWARGTSRTCQGGEVVAGTNRSRRAVISSTRWTAGCTVPGLSRSDADWCAVASTVAVNLERLSGVVVTTTAATEPSELEHRADARAARGDGEHAATSPDEGLRVAKSTDAGRVNESHVVEVEYDAVTGTGVKTCRLARSAAVVVVDRGGADPRLGGTSRVWWRCWSPPSCLERTGSSDWLHHPDVGGMPFPTMTHDESHPVSTS